MAEQTRQESGYAVGVQEFDWIRERQAVYVDKTEYVWKMVKTASPPMCAPSGRWA